MSIPAPQLTRARGSARPWVVSRQRVRFFWLFALILGAAFSAPVVSLGAIVAMSLIGLVMRLGGLRSHPYVGTTDVLVFVSVIYMATVAVLSWDGRASNIIFLAEAKLPLLLLAALAMRLVSRSVALSPDIGLVSNAVLIVNFAFLVIAKGQFRYIDQVPSGGVISIYMSVIFAIVFLLDRNLIRRGLILGFMVWLGSSTGLAALVAGVVVQRSFSRGRFSTLYALLALVLLVVFSVLLYRYTLDFRGRNILDLASIDRFQLSSAGVRYIMDTVDLRRFLFGYGTGSELDGILESFSTDASVLPWLVRARAIDGFTGLVFHNDFLRVFVNFGMVGSVLVWGTLFRFLRAPELRAMVIVASMLNSTIYINSIFLFVLLAQIMPSDRKQ
ncbi:MAG: hypothetical protein JXJ18_09560 [Rhodobacteraceae bacterium]|nr:hypothetical protein [Paracoccaceae bacterium]